MYFLLDIWLSCPYVHGAQTLILTEAEMQVLEELSARKDLSKTALLRQALRMYQLVEARLERGDRLFFEDEQTKEKAEVMML